ncbi:hypothetical protein AS850_03685 [Frondihabitans sp. 762G35]|uniref:hypothetical protein n=1 Tax=Frondihabitans sp. 762G35 TaxID=1446794 RepID=UPI000D20155E|nr:hypothetical protein [Frondihabitans sp. 762G35]ARC56177.1 hypothetical protein AS850_03685 [Frondihabitans sp. 762G35]
MRATRIVFVTVGALGIVFGAWVMVDTVRPKSIWGLATWLIGAVIIHDAIIAPAVVAISIAMRRVGRRIPPAVIAIVQGAVVVGSVFTLVVVPEIIRKAKVPNNDTVLPFDYASRLVVLWAAIVVITALVVTVYLRRSSRQKARPSTRQV